MVEMSNKEWQELHSTQFEQRILDGVWKRIAWIGGGLGIGSLVVLLGMLWGPIKTQIIADINKEVFEKLTAEAQDRLRSYATEIVAAEAARRVEADLRQQGSSLNQQLQASLRDAMNQGLLRDALAGELGEDFRNGGLDLTRRVTSFRFLAFLAPDAAIAAFDEALRQRLNDPASRRGLLPGDQVFTEALLTLSRVREQQRLSQTEPPIRDVARRVMVLAQETRGPRDDSEPHRRLVEAAAAWFTTLSPADVAENMLGDAILGGRLPDGSLPVAWDILLGINRSSARARLAALIHRAGPDEARRALNGLSAAPWPAFTPEAAEAVLSAIAPLAPDATLGLPLTPPLLEARFALTRPAAQGPATALAASLASEALRSPALPESWSRAAREVQRGVGANAAQAAAASAPAAMPSLPLDRPEDRAFWPLLVLRVLVAAASGDEAAAAEKLLPDLPDGANAPVLMLHERRLALLALGLADPAWPADRPRPAAIDRRLLRAILAHPSVETSPLLGIALQRLLQRADAGVCDGLAPGARIRNWVFVAVTACALSSDDERQRLAIAEWLGTLRPEERPRLFALWMLSRPPRPAGAAPHGPGFAWPEQVDNAGLAALIAEAVRPAEPAPPGPGARALLEVLRPLAKEQIDRALAAGSQLLFYPAAAQASRNATPDWAWEEAWTGAVRVEADEAAKPTMLSARQAYAFRIACRPGQAIGLEADEALDEVLAVWRSAPPVLLSGQARPRIDTTTCADPDVLVRVRSAKANRLTIVRLTPTPRLAVARRWEDRASVPAIGGGTRGAVTLRGDERVFVPLRLEPGRLYRAQTVDLTEGADTILAVHDATGNPVDENDDAGDGGYGSLLWLDGTRFQGDASLSVYLFNRQESSFDLELREVGEIARLAPGETRAVSLERGEPAPVLVRLARGTRYLLRTLDLEGETDTALTLFGPGGAKLAEDDDGGGGLASAIQHDAEVDGDYLVIARELNGRAARFSLSVAAEPR
jgi:hypothetical protein